MPTREQVREVAGEQRDYLAAGRQLGIPAGQAYLIATGQPADGGDSPSRQQVSRGGLEPSSQSLVNPPPENPTSRQVVREWIAARVAADEQMRKAGAARQAESGEAASAETRSAEAKSGEGA
jgi:hypothetical protein